MEGPRKADDGCRAGGATRARTYTPHTSNRPRETQRTAQQRWPCIPRTGGHPHPPHAPQRRLPSAAVERLPGVPFRRGGTRARPVRRRQPAQSPPPRCQAPDQDAGALSRRLPSSGRQAQLALIPALKLNTRAAREAAREVERPRRHREEHRHTPRHAPSHTAAPSPTPAPSGSSLKTTGSGFSRV